MQPCNVHTATRLTSDIALRGYYLGGWLCAVMLRPAPYRASLSSAHMTRQKAPDPLPGVQGDRWREGKRDQIGNIEAWVKATACNLIRKTLLLLIAFVIFRLTILCLTGVHKHI